MNYEIVLLRTYKERGIKVINEKGGAESINCQNLFTDKTKYKKELKKLTFLAKLEQDMIRKDVKNGNKNN